MIEIYTDGAYNPALGQGGWAAVLVSDGKKQEFSGTAARTTSNRMEITAALEGVSHTSEGAEVSVFTDSQYLFGCMTQAWQRKANVDLLSQLDKAVALRKVSWEWINGDSDNPHHKEAHALATGLSAKKAEKKAEVPVAAELSHVDAAGRPSMVDVSAKPDTEREAVARCLVRMQSATLSKIVKGEIKKGNVLTVAQLAGIMAAKKTPELIPLCHPLLINKIDVALSPNEKEGAVEITARVKCTGKTGVEMEAMTAAAVSALTVYDMCKAVDRGMRVEGLRLIRKSGGRSGTIVLEPE